MASSAKPAINKTASNDSAAHGARESFVKTPATSIPASEPVAATTLRMQVRNLNFYYGKTHALHNVNLDVAANKVTALIGPSGCGKSTLLRTLNRMQMA